MSMGKTRTASLEGRIDVALEWPIEQYNVALNDTLTCAYFSGIVVCVCCILLTGSGQIKTKRNVRAIIELVRASRGISQSSS